jgi:N utilization substance protein A
MSAQTGKQMIIQAIRTAERENQTRAYEEKRAEIITAVVDKVDMITGNLVLDTGTGYATILKSELIPGEVHEVGDRIKVFISEVKSGEMRGPLVTLSRVHPNFVKRLFELEIPEIQDGTIVIKGISREAGSRTKIAVESRDENVDAIGSCIGKNGMRINAILDELNGEKIDIIKYSDVIEEYVAEALSPAKVISVRMDGERSCRVTVAPEQLSLAIGKEGQNAKLVARLTGCKIDIKA